MLEIVFRRIVAKVFEKSIKRGLSVRIIAFADAAIPVVIAGDSNDWPRVILVRLVELRYIIGADAVEINDVTEVVKEHRHRLLVAGCRADLNFHGPGHRLLHLRPGDAAGIPYGVEHQTAG